MILYRTDWVLIKIQWRQLVSLAHKVATLLRVLEATAHFRSLSTIENFENFGLILTRCVIHFRPCICVGCKVDWLAFYSIHWLHVRLIWTWGPTCHLQKVGPWIKLLTRGSVRLKLNIGQSMRVTHCGCCSCFLLVMMHQIAGHMVRMVLASQMLVLSLLDLMFCKLQLLLRKNLLLLMLRLVV